MSGDSTYIGEVGSGGEGMNIGDAGRGAEAGADMGSGGDAGRGDPARGGEAGGGDAGGGGGGDAGAGGVCASICTLACTWRIHAMHHMHTESPLDPGKSMPDC